MTEEIDTEYTQRLLSLIQVEGRLSNNLRRSINEEAREFLNSLTPDAADFLLYDFDTEKHSDEDVRALVRAVPDCISHPVNDYGDTPIDMACETHHDCSQILKLLHLIPLLAEEWISLTGGSHDAREGLFRGHRVIEYLCNTGSRNSRDSTKCLNVLNRLCEMDLFRKEEIGDSEILLACIRNICFFGTNGGDWRIFKFLIDWDPEAMNKWEIDEGRCFINQVIPYISFLSSSEDEFVGGLTYVLKEVLSIGLSYHLDKLGFLFEIDDNGQSAWDCGCEKLGRYEMWNIVDECIKYTGNDKFLVERCKDGTEFRTLSFSPLFMIAISSDIPIKLDIIYHLLKKDPAKWT